MKVIRNGYAAYNRYQRIAESANARYEEVRNGLGWYPARVWSYITQACVKLSLSESTAFPPTNAWPSAECRTVAGWRYEMTQAD